MILYPWAYDRLEHSKEKELDRLGRVGAQAMGRGYTVSTVAKVPILFTWVQNRKTVFKGGPEASNTAN